jgi:hypothetical protein
MDGIAIRKWFARFNSDIDAVAPDSTDKSSPAGATASGFKVSPGPGEKWDLICFAMYAF